MGPDPKILDDIARVAGGAVNIVSGMQQQLREEVRTRMEEMAARLDLVPREDLDQAVAMIGKLRRDLEALEARLDKLEGTKAQKPAAKAKTAKAKTGKATAKKAPAKKTGSAKPKGKATKK